MPVMECMQHENKTIEQVASLFQEVRISVILIDAFSI